MVRRRRAVTLIEMLIALALTLLVMAAVVQMFDVMATNVSGSRAMLEISDQLRFTRNRLQHDLESATCPTLPWVDANAGYGYFEYIEGAQTDADPTALAEAALVNVDQSVLGDYDDVLMFTARSRGEPFVGIINGNTVESDTAEIIWWAVEHPDTGFRTIYRRTLLVAPWLAPGTFDQSEDDISIGATGQPNTLSDLTRRENRYNHAANFPHTFAGITPFSQSHARYGEDVMLANVVAFDIQAFDPMADIYKDTTSGPAPPSTTQIENDSSAAGFTQYTGVGYQNNHSYASNSGGPKSHTWTFSGLPPKEYEVAANWAEAANRATNSPYSIYDGSNLLATVRVNQQNPPSEFNADGSGWDSLGGPYAINSGTLRVVLTNDANSYVIADAVRIESVEVAPEGENPATVPSDAGYPAGSVVGKGAYVDLGFNPSLNTHFSDNNQPGGLLTRTFDTWPNHYESDGADQDGVNGADQGTNGLDDDGTNGVDDPGERETVSPYPFPLRGIKVRMRVYERDSRQLRQVSVIQNFVPL